MSRQCRQKSTKYFDKKLRNLLLVGVFPARWTVFWPLPPGFWVAGAVKPVAGVGARCPLTCRRPQAADPSRAPAGVYTVDSARPCLVARNPSSICPVGLSGCRPVSGLLLSVPCRGFLIRSLRGAPPARARGKPAVAARFPGLGGTTTPPKGCFVLCATSKNLKTASNFPRCIAGKSAPVSKKNCVVVGISRYMVFCQKMEIAKNC